MGNLKKPTLAVVLGTSRSSGGGNVYEEALLNLIRTSNNILSKWNVRVFIARDNKFHELGSPNLSPTSSAGSPSTDREHKSTFRRIFRRKRLSLDDYLLGESVDLIYFASLNRVQNNIVSLPFMSTIWDIGHRDLPEFPEFRGNTWTARERLLSEVLPRSFHTFTDSLQTTNTLTSLYAIDSGRVSELGLLPSVPPAQDCGPLPSDLRETKFFIYPAKMWPHKNHLFLLRAFRQLVDLEPLAKLVLTGDDSGAQGELVTHEIRRLGIEGSVFRLGFVDVATLGALIKHAVALVMPTYLGPTNLPPLQAVLLGTPAIVSDRHRFSPDIQRHMAVLSLESESAWALAMRDMLHARPIVPRIEVDLRLASREIERILDRFLSRRSAWSSFSQ